jgi:hypothetical protein
VRNYKRAEEVGLKQESEERRKTNKERSCAMLRFLGVEFEAKNEGVHLIVRHGGRVIDFWPSTGKFIEQKPGAKPGRGVFNMLKSIGIDPKAAKETPSEVKA